MWKKNETQTSDDTLQLIQSAGLTTDRIQALGDSIFAFAMTLLVLNFRLPTATGPLTTAGHVLVGLIPQFIIYVLSFIGLGVLWVAHHKQYNWIQRSNRTFLWINIFFFMFIVLVPFFTDLLATYPADILAVIFYGLNLIVCTSILYLHWWYATDKHTLVVTNATDAIIFRFKARMSFSITSDFLALIVSLFSIRIGVFMLILIQVLSIVPSIAIDKIIALRHALRGAHS